MEDKEFVFTKQEKALIRQLQEDIPLISAPFQDIGKKVGLSQEQVLATIQAWKSEGVIRRFGAALKHHKAGVMANVMVVWKVPKDRTKEVGATMASFPGVSHCYERPVLPEWPYNLFTMIHGRTADECRAITKEISKATGIQDYQLLFSTKEYKKSSMKYFLESA